MAICVRIVEEFSVTRVSEVDCVLRNACVTLGNLSLCTGTVAVEKEVVEAARTQLMDSHHFLVVDKFMKAVPR